ncbi:hypothetical protein GGF32_009468 [Allomyces javanicus]|nr:hypothetical protein GGF32_009468 [Allomyces javanicus]
MIARVDVRGAMTRALDAARLGHTRMLEWWVHNRFPVAKYTLLFVCTASAHGRIDVLEWTVHAGLPIRQNNDAMDVASAHGHIDVLEWWCDAIERGIVHKLPFQAPLSKASITNHVEVLDWWWRKFGCVPSSKDRDYGVVVASQCGHLEALDWWLADKKRWGGGNVPTMNMALNAALYKNEVANLDRWKRLVVESHAADIDQSALPNSVPPQSWWADCGFLFPPTICPAIADFTNASRGGAVESMRWWATHKLPYSYSSESMNCASFQGHVAVLDWWLRESGVELLYTAAALGNASRQARTNVLEWWKQSGLPLKIDVLEWTVHAGLPIRQNNDAMDVASAHGHIDVLEWWCDAIERGIVHKLPFQEPLPKASTTNQVEVLNWWWRKFGCVPSSKDRDHGVVVASRSGHLAALRWWLADKKRWGGGNVPTMNMALNTALYKNNVAILDRWKRLVVESHAADAEHSALPNSVPPPSWWADCGFLFPSTICPILADFTNTSRGSAVDAMRWWATHKLPFLHSPEAMDCASLYGHVAVLDWWLRESGVETLYTAAALDFASRQVLTNVLEWWKRSGLPLKYTAETRRYGLALGQDDMFKTRFFHHWEIRDPEHFKINELRNKIEEHANRAVAAEAKVVQKLKVLNTT